LGKLTEDQEKALESAAEGGLSEKELFPRLGVDEKLFGNYLRSLRKDTSVFSQEVSPNELAAVSGGSAGSLNDGPEYHCTETLHRHIYIIKRSDGTTFFPNCAATVEDGSWCSTNDACYEDAIWYVGMQSCPKAWE